MTHVNMTTAALLVVVGVLAYSFAHSVHTPLAPDTSGWKVYRDAQHGFELKYPSDFAIVDELTFGVLEGSVVNVKLADESYYRGTNLVEAAVMVNVQQGRQAQASCLRSSASDGKSAYKINGVIFRKEKTAEGATGHYYEKTTYRTLYSNACYELVLLLHSNNVTLFEPGTVSEFDKADVLQKLKAVMGTFRFLHGSSPVRLDGGTRFSLSGHWLSTRLPYIFHPRWLIML